MVGLMYKCANCNEWIRKTAQVPAWHLRRLAATPHSNPEEDVSAGFRTILFSALVATSCAPEETICLTDTDCDQGQVCVSEVCTTSCITATDCAEDEECIARDEGQGRACQVAGGANVDTGGNAEEDAWVILIRDQSATDCDSETPGADIVGLRVRDATGDVMARGQLILGDLQPESNPSIPGELDGMTFTEDCDEPAVSLGCGGWVALRPVNEDGLTVPLTVFAESIETVEWGESCGENSRESYAVYACNDSNAVANNDDISSCTRLLDEGSGSLVFTP